MKIEKITSAEQACRALAHGRKLEFRGVIDANRPGRWVEVGTPRMSVADAVTLFDDLLTFGEVRACRR